MDHEGRITKLVDGLSEHDIDGLVVTKLINVRYLTGFTGSAGALLVTGKGAWFFTDGRYITQAAEEVQGAEVQIYETGGYGDLLRKTVAQTGAARLGFDAKHLPVADQGDLARYVEGYELVPTQGLVEEIRKVKEPAELELIRTAAQIADAGLTYILGRVRPGMTERELALDLEFYMRNNGASDVSFDVIVAAAERSALPHAHPTDRTVESGRYLLFDLGCVYQGYCSDVTRTVVVGDADDRHREIYELVARAEQAGLDAISSGTEAVRVDEAARKVIAEAGHAEAFSHGLGHGVGIEVHEAPTLNTISKDVLASGHVVTCEPGVYFGGWGGVRVEDLVIVTDTGCEVLSKSPKELIVL